MSRTTLVATGDAAPHIVANNEEHETGSLKVFFGYAPCSGATAAMLDEVQGLVASGRDVLVADPEQPATGSALSRGFDLDQVLKRRPDLVVLEDLARPNPAGSRNRTRYQDAEELLRAGIDVYATLRVADLQSERTRVRSLGVEVPPESVPDYLFYGAQRLEFVDIDPTELERRAQMAGRDIPEEVLIELRVLALRCVGEYAATAGLSRSSGSASEVRGFHSRVVVLVGVESAPGSVLLEAARLAAASHAELEVVCVRGERSLGSSKAQEMAYASLQEQVEAMGHELVTFYGDDVAAVVSDYVRTQGATDVVLARPQLHRWAAPFVRTVADRLVDGLPGVNVHVVAVDATTAGLRTAAWNRLPSGMRVVREVAMSLAAVAIAMLLVRGLWTLGAGESVSYVVFIAAGILVAALTRSASATCITVLLSGAAQDYFFLRPFDTFAIDHQASAYVFMAFMTVSAVASLAVARAGRVAERSESRERRTQALFDLSRSLLYARGTADVVDVALDVCLRLFGRSVAIYLCDPFEACVPGERDHRAPTVREAEGDLGLDAFEKLTEQAIVHWVFTNDSPAGSGTGTHEASDICYLPLGSQEGIEGVLAVSCRRSLGLADRSFLDLVASEISLALERQSLAGKHRRDLQAMHVTDVRNTFVSDITATGATTVATVHALADVLVATPDDDHVCRDVLERAIIDETARGRLMIDRVQRALATPPGPLCGMRREVSAAVEEVREGLAGKVIDLEPGEPVAPVVADSVLVRMAVKLVLEAATSYVGPRGIVQVSVRSYPDHVAVVIADDRPADASPTRGAAFETATRAAREGVPVYDEMRAKALREALADRCALGTNQQGGLEALCKAMHLPEEAARADGDRGDGINRQRVLRYDRLEYGLYVAALAVYAHGGTIKQRYRLGGGAVVTLSFPRI